MLVTQSYPTLCNPMDYIAQQGFPRQEYWSRLPFPSPGIFPTQGSNAGLLHCKQILCLLSHQASSTNPITPKLNSVSLSTFFKENLTVITYILRNYYFSSTIITYILSTYTSEIWGGTTKSVSIPHKQLKQEQTSKITKQTQSRHLKFYTNFSKNGFCFWYIF